MSNIERFYKRRNKSISYIKRHCMDSQEFEIEDIYHDALIVANRRKEADSTRDDGLCLFSGYSTALRSGNHSDWHYKYNFIDYESEFISKADTFMQSPSDACEENSSLDLVGDSIALLVMFCGHLRPSLNISLTFFFGEYDNMSEVGRFCGISRERVRQLRNSGLIAIKAMINEITQPMLKSLSSFFMIPIDRNNYYLNMERVPNHLTFHSLRKSFNDDFAISFFKYLKVLSVIFEDFTTDFCFESDTNYKGLIMEESLLVSKDIFMCLNPSPLTLYYHDYSEVLEIGWLRELFAKFVKSDRGWYDELALDEGDEVVFYPNILEVVDQVVMDYISENFEVKEFRDMERDLNDKFLKFFR